MSRADQVSACRRALILVASEVSTYECDIPWYRSQDSDWPADVIAAARRLSSHSEGKRGENDGYRRTGVLTRDDEAGERDWSDFVPSPLYAYESSTWSTDPYGFLTDFNNEGASLAVRLTQDEAGVLAAEIGAERVRPQKGWRTRLGRHWNGTGREWSPGERGLWVSATMLPAVVFWWLSTISDLPDLVQTLAGVLSLVIIAASLTVSMSSYKNARRRGQQTPIPARPEWPFYRGGTFIAAFAWICFATSLFAAGRTEFMFVAILFTLTAVWQVIIDSRRAAPELDRRDAP
ncbi:hypothetical protein [Aeromicrobium sp.]